MVPPSNCRENYRLYDLFATHSLSRRLSPRKRTTRYYFIIHLIMAVLPLYQAPAPAANNKSAQTQLITITILHKHASADPHPMDGRPHTHTHQRKQTKQNCLPFLGMIYNSIIAPICSFSFSFDNVSADREFVLISISRFGCCRFSWYVLFSLPLSCANLFSVCVVSLAVFFAGRK